MTTLLSQCIGLELRFIFAPSIKVNLLSRSAECFGNILESNASDNASTTIKFAFGNRLKEGFFLTSFFELKEGPTKRLKLKLAPLGYFDDKFSKYNITVNETVRSAQLLQKKNQQHLLLRFESGNAMLFSAAENDHLESCIIVHFFEKLLDDVLPGYDTLDNYQ